MASKHRFLLILLMLSQCVFAQKETRLLKSKRFIEGRHCITSFSKVSQRFKDHTQLATFLKDRKGPSFKKQDLSLKHQLQSILGQHFTFVHQYKNIPVYNSEIKINLDNEGYVTSTFDNILDILPDNINLSFPDSVSILNFINSNVNGAYEYKTEKMLFFNGEEYQPVVKLQVLENKTSNAIEYLINDQTEIVYQTDMHYHKSPQLMITDLDTLINGKVFLPDPLTTAHVTYGAPYVDNNDSDVVVLNAERKLVQTNASLINDTFRLESPFVKILDFSEPIVPVVYSTTPDFFFTRNQQGFEDINAFYHINSIQKHIQSLGFTNAANYQIHVDTHGSQGADNSSFSYFSVPPRLLFGEGNVDDAEDADVIIHEYTHAISYDVSKGTNVGTERQTIDEANGDYFAASYSRSLDEFNWDNIFPWDGHNEFWAGRTAKTTKTYPDAKFQNIYSDANIWSGTLMQIWEDVGRNVTDKLVIQSMFGYAKNMKMPDAANLIIQADSSLYAGAHYKAILKRFVDRKILPDPVGIASPVFNGNEIKIKNSEAFAKSEEPLSIELYYNKPVTAILYSVNGQKIKEETFETASPLSFNCQAPPGIYILQLQSEDFIRSFKVFKF